MSAFDASTFLDMPMDQPLVKRPPVPVGDYIGVIKDPVPRNWVSPKVPTKSGIAFDYPVEVDVPQEIRERLGILQPTITVKYQCMIDMAPDGKSFDMSPGANSGLRRLREAVDLNKPGDSFNPKAPVGRAVKVKISHREYPIGSGDLFEDVAGIAKV